MTAVELNRAALAGRGDSVVGASPPVRIVHVGLGHFFRAHQAWYTAHAADAAEWGIAAFTGRSPLMAEALNAQDGLFALVERGPDADRVEIVTSVVEAVAGTDLDRLVELVSDPRVAIVTLTVTESGYRLHPDGSPDRDDPELMRDIDALRRGAGSPVTVPGRLLAALAGRRHAGAGPIAVVSCDNIPGNGAFVQRGLTSVAELIDPELADWIGANVSFVSTSVDRITPHTDDAAAVAEAGWIDRAPVVTEPFADWVLAGDFPSGRPDWESAGARFVDDIEPWEHRKLWLLNGAHSILTFAGLVRGLETVAEAVADADCRAIVEEFWTEAVQCLPPGTEHIRYREQLIDRFANPRIVHRLAQIAAEATVKVQFRFAAVAERTVAAGRDPEGSIRALAAWIDWVMSGPEAPDARSAEIADAAASSDPAYSLLNLVSPSLAADPAIVDRIRSYCAALSTSDPIPDSALVERTP